MKTLIINGSPRRSGIISKLLQEAQKVSDGEHEIIHVYDCRIKPCTACMQCRTLGKCILPHDDAHEIAEKISRADLLIVGTPTYWGNMSGVLKNMFDRLVPIFMGETGHGIPIPRQKNKKAIIIASCSTPFPFNILMGQSRGAVRAVREILKTAGYRIRSLEIPGTKHMKILPSKYTKRLTRIIEKSK